MQTVTGARLGISRRTHDQEAVYQVILVTPDGDRACGFPGSSSEVKQRAATRVAEFVDGKGGPSLEVRQVGLIGWSLGSLFVLSGVVVLFDRWWQGQRLP